VEIVKTIKTISHKRLIMSTYEKTSKSKSTDSLKIEKVSYHIPDDISFSILLKLPLKSLVRFRCVRKSWSVLFENPYYMNMYRINFACNNNYSYVDDSCLKLESIEPYYEFRVGLFSLSGEKFENKVKLDWPPPIQENDQGLCILGSVVDGTVCFYKGLQKPIITFWNIATKEFKVIPHGTLQFPPTSYEGVVFSLHGFGLDQHDHKVIRHAALCTDLTNFKGPIPPHDSMWEVYSLRSNSWKKLDVDMPSGYLTSDMRVHINGVCHWLDQIKDCLVSFDLSNNTFFRTLLPSKVHVNFDFVLVDRRFMALNGSIAFISSYETSNANKSTTFHISILGELGVEKSWTKLFVVGPLDCVDHPVGAGNKGEIFFQLKDGELAQFDLSTQTVKNYCIKDVVGAPTLLYKEILLPVGAIRNVRQYLLSECYLR
jgi:molecular chaperone HtpG